MRSFAFFIVTFFAGFGLMSQEIPIDLVPDTAQISLADSTIIPNLSLPSDSVPPPVAQGAITTTVNYHARDSMFFDVKSQQLSMYGETHIDYGSIQLEAEETHVDWVKQTIKSDFVLDSDGNKIGKPIFTDREKVYATNAILYDFKSRKAKISGVITEQDGAFMHGARVKKNEKDEMFITKAQYTTCNLADPHFFISSKTLKAIPGNKVISGPANLKFREVPTPLWVPFAMFPQPKKKASGIVIPTYGEERVRGFFLKNGGYYFAISDYTDLRVTGDIYSNGGYALVFNQNYLKRYRNRGTFNFSYTKNVTESAINDLEQDTYWVRWNHTPQSRGNSRFSASVSVGSSSYNSSNNLVINDFQRSITAQFSSNISYSTRFRGTPYSMTSSLRINQNIQTKILNLTFPELTLSMARIYPFKNVAKSSSSPLAKLSLSHTFSSKNELTNAPRTGFNFDVSNENNDSAETSPLNSSNFDEILSRSRSGGKHNIPISTSFNLLKYFTLSPSLTYEEVWYTRELKFTDYDTIAEGVRVDTVQGFSRASSWRGGASLNSRLYGLYPIGWKNIQAIRHVVTPSITFSYNPDFGDPKHGVFSDVIINAEGDVRQLSKYEGFIYGSPSGNESRTMGFSVTNNLEMKVLDKADSTGETFRKIKLFDNLSVNSGYNFAADSFKLSDISLSARTSLFKGKLSISTRATLDPYIYQFLSSTETSTGRRVTQRKIDRYAWNNGQGLGQLKSINMSFNLNLKGKSKATSSQQSPKSNQGFGRDSQDPFNAQYNNGTEEDEELEQLVEHIKNNPDLYVDFNVPWSLRAAYTVSRRKTGFDDVIIRKNMTFSGSLGLTDNMQITFNSGYDFENKEFTTTTLSVHRDLHCWTLDLNWVPFGTFQSYMISLRVKSSILQDLKVEKRKNFFDFFGN